MVYLNVDFKESEQEATEAMTIEAAKRGLTLDQYKKQLEDNAKAHEDYVKSVTNGFSKLVIDTRQSFVQIADIMLKNQKAIDEWGNNLARLTAVGLGEWARVFESQGVEKGGALADELVSAINQMQSQTGHSINQLIADFETMPESFDGILSRANIAILSKLSETQGIFKNTGAEISNGLGKGIENNADSAYKSMDVLASGLDRTARMRLETFSPSRVMIEIGQNVGEGLAVGINNSSSKVQEAMQSITNLLSSIGNNIKTVFINVANDVKTSVNNLVSNVNSGLADLSSKVAAFFTNIVNNARNGAASFVN